MTQPPNYSMVWNDEFNGNALDTTKWSKITFHPNNPYSELEIYQADDVYLSGTGSLVLRSQKRNVGGYAYTSGAVWSLDKKYQKYGYFEAKIKMPSGTGMWPGWWMVGQNLGTGCPGASTGTCSKWPPEIDILEYVTRLPTQYHVANVWGTGTVDDAWISTNVDLRNDYHVYGLEWTATSLKWYFDDHLVHTITTNIPTDNMYVYLNDAIGGTFGGSIVGTTFPQYMYVDYVRVYKKVPECNPASILQSVMPGTAHEDLAHGVPDNLALFRWKYTAVDAYPANTPLSAPTNYIDWWGQIYVNLSNYHSPNTRVAVRNIRMFFLYSDESVWRMVQEGGGIGGSDWPEDFSTGNIVPSNRRIESDGSVSFIPSEGHNCHFWSTLPYINARTGVILHVLVIAETKLILDNPALPDDRNNSAYIIGMGADHRPLTGGPVYDMGVGKFIKSTKDWRSVILSTLTYDDLTSRPLPSINNFICDCPTPTCDVIMVQ